MSASENLLPLAKKTLLIPEAETFADLEITALIDSGTRPSEIHWGE